MFKNIMERTNFLNAPYKIGVKTQLLVSPVSPFLTALSNHHGGSFRPSYVAIIHALLKAIGLLMLRIPQDADTSPPNNEAKVLFCFLPSRIQYTLTAPINLTPKILNVVMEDGLSEPYWKGISWGRHTQRYFDFPNNYKDMVVIAFGLSLTIS